MSDTALATQNNRDVRGVLPSLLPLPRTLFGSPFIDRVMDTWGGMGGNLMRHYQKEDGSTCLEYNLAGYAPEDISIKADTATGELMISAKSEVEGNRRAFATTVTLSPYTSPEDIKTSLKNGVLEVTIAPLEKRKQEALVEIPLSS